MAEDTFKTAGGEPVGEQTRTDPTEQPAREQTHTDPAEATAEDGDREKHELADAVKALLTPAATASPLDSMKSAVEGGTIPETRVRNVTGASASTVRPRIHFLDEVRGLAVCLMFVYHGFFTLNDFFHRPIGLALADIFGVAQPFFAGLFIFLCGISCHLSHNNLKRGLILVGVSGGISVFLWIFVRDSMIWYGILHFLATAILLYCLFERLLKRVPTWLGLSLCAVGLLLTMYINPEPNGHSIFGIRYLLEFHLPDAIVQCKWLLPFGLGYAWSTDYFPLLPWIFVFFAGAIVGRGATAGWFPSWMYRKHSRLLSWVGRNALWAYLLHQPVLISLMWVFFFIKGFF